MGIGKERGRAAEKRPTDPVPPGSGSGPSVLARTFGLDLRALAALRIGLGALVLSDLVWRAPFLVAHYTDAGVLPRAATRYPGLYSLADGAPFAAFLFVAAGVFAVLLAIGWRTRLATAASWVLLLSLHHRNPLLIDAGDKLLALLLFWGMFLPLGARASLDARRRGAAFAPSPVLSVASLGLAIQIACVYVFSAILKNPRLWLLEGSAIRYALEVDEITTAFGRSFLAFPALLVAVSRAAIVLELFGPFFLFVPLANAFFRIATVGAFVGFHVALAVWFHLGLFPFVCIAAWSVFLPAPFWDALARRWAAVPSLASHAGSSGAARHASLGSWVAGAALGLVLVWNVVTISADRALPRPVRWVGEALGLRQRWSMFGSPPRYDGWWVMPARLGDGAAVDLFASSPRVSWEKPPDVAATFVTLRERKFLEHLLGAEHRDALAHYAAWRRRRWNAGRPPARRVEEMEVFYVAEAANLDGPPTGPRRVLLYSFGAAGERVVSYDQSAVVLRELFTEPQSPHQGAEPPPKAHPRD